MWLVSVSAAIRWTLCCILLALLVPQAAHAGAYESLSINTPLAHDIIRQAKSAGMKSFIDETKNPCNSFYGYACGNYANINPTENMYGTDIEYNLENAYNSRVDKLLKKPKISSDSAAEMRVKLFYDSCQQRREHEWNDASRMLAIFAEFGGFPGLGGAAWNESNFDVTEVMALLLRRYNKITLLNVRLAPDLNNSQINRLYLGQRYDMGSHESLFYTRNEEKLQNSLIHFLKYDEWYARDVARDITRFHDKLHIGVHLPTDEVSLKQLSKLRMLSDMDEIFGPILNLTRFVRIWLDRDYNLPVYQDGDRYLFRLKALLDVKSKVTVANYMLASLLPDYDVRPCSEVTVTMFPDYVDHMVYRDLEQQTPHLPGSIRQLWHELKESFGHILRESWLDKSTLSAALDKLKAMTYDISGAEIENLDRDFYDELVISNSDYFGNVRRVLEFKARNLRENLQHAQRAERQSSPHYDKQANRVHLPVAYLQYRYLYDELYPTAIKYGTLGYILAREMAHGFDHIARFFDAQGNQHNWWHTNSSQTFETRKQCLVEHFEQFLFGDHERHTRLHCQSEYIADNIGVRIAHGAYLNWQRQQPIGDTKSNSEPKPDPEVLPKLSLNSEQLFFLALGQLSCTNPSEEWIYSSIIAPKMRLDAIAANFGAFAESFECAQGSAMGPTEKCAIF